MTLLMDFPRLFQSASELGADFLRFFGIGALMRGQRTADKTGQIAPPLLKGLAPLFQVLRMVVLAGHAALVRTDVVDDRLDNVRLGKAQLVDVRDEGSADVVKRPMRERC